MSLELPKSVVIIAAFLAVALTALQPALAAKRQTEMHDCPAGTKWSCETRPNTSKPTACGIPGTIFTGHHGCRYEDTKVCGCN